MVTGAAVVRNLAAEATKADGWPTKEELNAIYRKNSEFFRLYLPEKFAALGLDIEQDDWIRGPRQPSDEGKPHLWVNKPAKDGEIYGIIQVTKSGYVISAGAHVFHRGTPHERTVPMWDLATAIERACNALKSYGWEVPPDMQMNALHYVSDGTWEITWNRVFGGVLEVQQDSPIDKIGVIINEDGSGIRFIRWRRDTVPPQTTPKLSQTEAVILAAKAVPQIMATGLYRSWMPKNLAPVELKTIDLRICIPNWILDPKRFSMDTDNTMNDRRLCWRATFLLYRRDTVGEQEKRPVYKATNGLVHVHVDAISGEIVGGNMEPIANDGISLKFGNQ